MRETINIFFSCDSNYIPFLAVSLQSLEDNANKKDNYKIKILHTNNVEKKDIEKIEKRYCKDNFDVRFVDISDKVAGIHQAW